MSFILILVEKLRLKSPSAARKNYTHSRNRNYSTGNSRFIQRETTWKIVMAYLRLKNINTKNFCNVAVTMAQWVGVT